MGRRVKHCDTGEYSTNDVSYKAENGKYYSSKEAYESWKTNKDYRQKCINKMYDFMEYQTFMKIPSVFFKSLSEWEGYGYDVVYEAMLMIENDIEWARENRHFENEQKKVRYYSAIIQNHLNDAKMRLEREKRLTTLNHDTIIEDINILGGVKVNKNISRFLEDED